MLTMLRIGWLVALVFVAACNARGELDHVCQAFIALEAQPDLSVMDEEQRLRFVDERVSPKFSLGSKVAPLWKLLPNFESEARYRMFKRGADELAGSWDCPAMERLAPSLTAALP